MPPFCSEWRGRVNSKNPVFSVTSGPVQSIRLFLISGWLGFQSLFKWAPTKPEAPTSVLSLPVFLPLSFLLHSFSKYWEGAQLAYPLGQEKGGRVRVGVVGVLPFHMHGGEERQGSAGSGLPVLSCERQTFGRVITRRTALGVISDSCLFKVFGAHSLYGLRLPSLRLMFRLHLHEEESCMCQHKQCAREAHQVCTCLCFTDAQNKFYLTSRKYCYIIVEYLSQLV